MKMSRKTRIVSIVMCIALMMGIMSVGMMASAANSASPVLSWKANNCWAAEGANYSVTDGVISFDSKGGWSGQQLQVGSWNGGAFTTASFAEQAAGATGLVVAVELTKAAAVSGSNPSSLGIAMKITIKDKGTYVANGSSNIAIGGGATQQVFPVANFAHDQNGSALTVEDLANVTNFELTINTYGVFYGNSAKEVEGRYSSVYAYTGEPDVITLPGSETATTAAPVTTTQAPETTTKKEEPVVTTTQAPTTLAPTTAPVVENKEAKPAKVKGVKVKAGKKKVTVTWKKAKNAKKYTVKYSYKKNMKGAKTKTVKAAKVVLKKLKSGKKVYVQVCGVNGKTKGAFSKKVAKKVK